MRIFNDVNGCSSLINKAGKKLMNTTAMTAAGLLALSGNAKAANNDWADHVATSGGSISIDTSTPDTTNITQTGSRVTVSGDGDIKAGWTVNVAQPSTSSQYILFDTEGDPTFIRGNLNANGQIWIFDQNGVIFGENSVVDVGSIVASTAGFFATTINGDDANHVFTNFGDGEIINRGNITVAEAGLAAFVGPNVKNSGVINAKLGTVAMAAGQAVTLDMYGDGLIEVAVNGELADGLLKNTGEIKAAGGNVLVTAKIAKDAVDNVINMDGVVNVSSATVQGGKIILSGGSKGNVQVKGKLHANGKSGTDAGSIEVTGENITVTGSGRLRANAEDDAAAGDISVIADNQLTIDGKLSAQGLAGTGYIETSAPTTIFGAGASILATREWLLDPTNLDIDAALAALINAQLNLGDMTVQTNAGGAGAGNVTLLAGAAISKTAGGDSTFGINAHNDITILGTITGTGPGALNVDLNADFDVSGGDADVFVRNDINTNGGSFTATASDDIDVKSGATVDTDGGNVSIASRGLGDGSWLWMPGGGNSGDIVTDGGNVEITVDNIHIANGSSIDAGTGDVTIKRDVAGTIGLGSASGDMELSQAEIARIDAGTLTIGGTNTTGIDVDGVDTTSSTIAGLVTLNALGAGGDVNFDGANTFAALSAEADDDIHVRAGSSITTTTGGVSLTANNSSGGGLTVNQIEGTIDTTAAGTDGDVDLAATDYFVEIDATGKVLTDGGKLTATSNVGFDIDNGAMVMLGDGGAHIDAPLVQLGDDIDTTGPITGTASTVKVENDDAQIQDGVDVAANGATVTVADGTYNESVTVNKTGLQLLGANAGLHGTDGGRGPESIVSPNSPGFLITANDVVLDGFSIIGGDNGVHIDGASDVTVKNNIIDDSTNAGVFADGASGAIIERNNITDTDGDGVLLDDSDGSEVKGNTIAGTTSPSSASGNGIQVLNSDDVVIGGNGDDKNIIGDVEWDGVRIVNADNITVRRNEITGVERTGIYGRNLTNSRIARNKILTARNFYGIHLKNGDNVALHRNTIDRIKRHGIFTDGTSNLTVTKNNIDGTLIDGIHIKGSHGAVVSENKVGTDGGPDNIGEDGIHINGSNNTVVQSNTVRNTVANGIVVNPSDNVRILDNIITDIGEDGLHSEEGNDLRVRRNTIRRVGDDGMDITRNDRVRITNNVVTDTDKRGIFVGRANGEEELAVRVADNTVRRTGRTGIVVDRFTTARIVDNTVTDSNRNGIRAKRGDEAYIRRNTIRDIRRDGIRGENLDISDIRRNIIRRAGWDGIRLENFGSAWIAYNDIKWTGDDGIDVHDGDFVSIYDNYIDLAGFLPAELFGNEEVGEDANGIHVVNVGDGELPPLAVAEGFGYGYYGAAVEIHGNDVANIEDDGIQVAESESAYIGHNVIGHVGDDGIDNDNVGYNKISDNIITLAEDKGITVDGGNYAGVFNNRILLTGSDGVQVENIRYDHSEDITALGDDKYGYGWAVNVSGNEIAMTGDDAIEVRDSDATKVARNNIFMAGMGENLEGVIATVNDFANETFNPFVLAGFSFPTPDSFLWEWGDGNGINVHNIDGAYYSPNGWAADIRNNDVNWTGGHGVRVAYNDRTRVKNNRISYSGIEETEFYGVSSMISLIDNGPFGGEGRRDLWKSEGLSMIDDVLDRYIGVEEEPEPGDYEDYVTIDYVDFDALDGINAYSIYNSGSDDGLSGRSYLFDLKIVDNEVNISGDDNVEVVYAGRTLIARNTLRDAGQGGIIDYGSGDYYGGDNIHARYVTADLIRRGPRPEGIYDDEGPEEEGYDYEPRRNYALIIRDNDARRASDDNIEVVGDGYGDGPVALAGRGDRPYDTYGTTDRVLIAENTVRRAGTLGRLRVISSDGDGDSDIGPDGYGHDNIHVRQVGGNNYDRPEEKTGPGGSYGDDGGFYGYAVDIIGNDARHAADDNVEVIESASTLIFDNTLRNAGGSNWGPSFYGGDYYGADNIHVRNVGGFYRGLVLGGDYAGDGFDPYAVVIAENNARRAADDNIEVVGERFIGDGDGGCGGDGWAGRGDGCCADGDGADGDGWGDGDGIPLRSYGTGRTLIEGNDVAAAGFFDVYFEGEKISQFSHPSSVGDDGRGHDGIHVRGVGNNFLLPPYPGSESEDGYYGYAVNIIGNTVRRSGDDNVEVVDSESALIQDNWLRRAGHMFGYHGYHGADYYGADGIHVRNVGGFSGPIWFPGAAAGPVSGDGFEPYAVVIDGNNVRRSGDDNIEVVGETGLMVLTAGMYPSPPSFGGTGRTLIIDNDVRRSGFGHHHSDELSHHYGDGYGADGIHVRGVQSNFGDIFITQSPGFAGGPYGSPSFDVQIIGNFVKNAYDDGVEVIAWKTPYINGFGTNILVDSNYVENSGDDGIRILAEGGFLFPTLTNGRTVSLLPTNEINSVVSNNTVINSENDGLHIAGPSHDNVEVSGNTFTDNDIGAHFESGLIDLTGDGNIFNGGRVGMRFAPAEIESAYPGARALAIPFDPVFAPLSLVDDDGPGGFGGTIGAQTFNGQSQFFVELDNGAFFEPGTPTLLNALDSTFANTPFGTFTPNVDFASGLPLDVLAFLESRFFHFNDRGDLGLFFFPLLPEIDQEDIFNYFGPNAGALSGLNVTILGLPGIPGNPVALGNIAPFAGGDGGGEGLTPEQLNDIETAAGGGEETSCWNDALNAAGGSGPVSLNYDGGAEGLLNSESGCES